MTDLTIVGSLTAIRGSGKLELGLIQRGIKIYDVKELIVKEMPELHPSQISLWWKGYILDHDSLTLLKACVGMKLIPRGKEYHPSSSTTFNYCAGVNGESIDNNSDKLLIFMTIEPRDRIHVGRGHRSNSFDVEKLRLELRKQTMRLPCTIM